MVSITWKVVFLARFVVAVTQKVVQYTQKVGRDDCFSVNALSKSGIPTPRKAVTIKYSIEKRVLYKR